MAVTIELMSGATTIAQFRRAVWAHYRRAGRTTLPWRHTRDPYAILVSEVMLQQTQVARVEGYYTRWLTRFPDFCALARARTADVLAAWQGLGYNRRALFLKKTAERVVNEHGGRLPRSRAALAKLRGIGKGTSGSLMAFAFNEPEVFIETNIRRALIHFFFPRKKHVTDAELERYIKRSLDRNRPREWYWALMDYGAAIKRENPNRRSAHYKKQTKFEGSERQLRGRVLRFIISRSKRKKADIHELSRALAAPVARIRKVADKLEKEGFILREGNYIRIKK